MISKKTYLKIVLIDLKYIKLNLNIGQNGLKKFQKIHKFN